MHDTRVIAAARSEVWNGLHDPKVLMACIPGCEEFTGTPETGFDLVVVQKVGPVKVTIRGTIRLSEIEEPNSVRIEGEGQGGPVGFCKGSATVRLSPKDGGTEISYGVEANVGGKLARLGSGIIDGFARKMADRFFDSFKHEIETASAARSASPEDEPKPGWLRRLAERLIRLTGRQARHEVSQGGKT